MVDGACGIQEPSFEDALKVLLQEADEGRGEVLFGESTDGVPERHPCFQYLPEIPCTMTEDEARP